MKIKDNTLADLQSANVGDVVATSNGEHLLIVYIEGEYTHLLIWKVVNLRL